MTAGTWLFAHWVVDSVYARARLCLTTTLWCVNCSAAIVSSGEKGWLLWNFDVLPMTVQDNLGAPIVLSSRHSCGMFDAGGTAAVGGEQPGTGLAVVTKVSYTHLPPM